MPGAGSTAPRDTTASSTVPVATVAATSTSHARPAGSPEVDEEAAADDGVVHLERIVGERLRSGELQYRVKWRVRSEAIKTWESATCEALCLPAGQEAIDAFRERKARAAAQARADMEEAMACGWAAPSGGGGYAAEAEAGVAAVSEDRGEGDDDEG